MKIAFIGGGSVQWTPKLIVDMALNTAVSEAEVVLYDIDREALELLTTASQRLVAETKSPLKVSATLDRCEALQDADFVILCISIGGLEAMRHDVELPEQYGIYQAVGDTVGPGGLARGLRHLPFAVELAQEMERLCPNAWLVNLTNPMTTICRAVSKATSIKTIGLCHEETGVRKRLARILQVEPEAIDMQVGGINHLPVILDFTVNGAPGLPLLRAWLAEHSAFEFIHDHSDDVMDVFQDRLAIKLSLFEHMGILFGAGDRHVAEFFPGFLTDATEKGSRYGVMLTTIQHRQDLAAQRRTTIEQFVADGSFPESLQPSDEQLTSLIAALSGGQSGRFIVNIPNQGQIDNLPREAVVECLVEADSLGVRPIAVGALPHAASAAILPHVARQELIVDAALTGSPASALAALITDPLVHDPASAKPLLDALLAANARYCS